MKKDKKINEERLLVKAKTNIYKYSFYILTCLVFVDIMIKFNLYSFIEKPGYMWYLFGVEALFLVVAFYFNLFANASKGILLGSTHSSITKFPWKRYALISLVMSFILSVGMFSIRYIVAVIKRLDGDGGEYWLAFFVIITFIVAFVCFYLSYYIAYIVAIKNNRIEKLDK